MKWLVLVGLAVCPVMAGAQADPTYRSSLPLPVMPTSVPATFKNWGFLMSFAGMAYMCGYRSEQWSKDLTQETWRRAKTDLSSDPNASTQEGADMDYLLAEYNYGTHVTQTGCQIIAAQPDLFSLPDAFANMWNGG